jgi:hypothetical protein
MCPKNSHNGIKINTFFKGGKVKNTKNKIPSKFLKPHDKDRVLARLQVGELVIPKKHVKKVSQFLKQSRIKLPNM